MPKGRFSFFAISRYAEIVLARISIWRPMFIEPTGEMTLIARRVGVGLLDCCDELKREVMKMLTYNSLGCSIYVI